MFWYLWKKHDRVKKAMMARPDSGIWTSLLKEKGSSSGADAGTSTKRDVKSGTITVRKMNEK